MSTAEETHPVDELIRAVRLVPSADATEDAAVDAARRRLEAAMTAPGRAPAVQGRRRRRWRAPAGTVAVAISCGVTLLVAGIAVIALGGHRRPSADATLRGPAPGAGANALIAKLAVLRREQTAADQLPAKLHITTLPLRPAPAIIPSLSRLVATPPGARIYLVVTEPARGGDVLWSPSLGDQLNIVAITDSGATTEGFGYPAADMRDPRNVYLAGLQRPSAGGASVAQRLVDTYRVAIVPDGVARVRFMFAGRARAAIPPVTVRVANNVAITKITPASIGPVRTIWYAADGHIVPTSTAARTRAIAIMNAPRRRDALEAARRSHVTATPAILHAFAVFDSDSRSGIHVGDGYVISHPTLPELPLSVLPGGLGQRQQLDLRDVRKVVSPSGQTLYIVPGMNTICLFVMERGATGGGASGGCAGSLASALRGGAGESSSGTAIQGSMVYAVVPRTTRNYKLQTGHHAFRIIHPVDGIVIAHTPFQFG